MKKRKKLTVVQKLEDKIKRITRKMIKERERGDNAWIQYEKEHQEVIKITSQRAEQERIISMFKSCIDKNILERVLTDHHVKHLESRIQEMSKPTVRHLHTPCNHH